MSSRHRAFSYYQLMFSLNNIFYTVEEVLKVNFVDIDSFSHGPFKKAQNIDDFYVRKYKDLDLDLGYELVCLISLPPF